MIELSRHRLILRRLIVAALSLALFFGMLSRPAQAADIARLQTQAQQLIQKRQYNKALDVLKKITSLQPEDQRSWFNLGVVAYQAKNLDGARWGFSKAYRLNSGNDVGKRALGILIGLLQTSAQQGDVAETKKLAETIEAMDARNAAVPFALGLLSMRKKEYEEASHQFKRSVELDSKNFDGWMNLGFAEAAAKDYKAAIAAYDKASALKPTDPRPQEMIAQTALQSNDLEAAEKGFKAVVARQPNNAMARLQYAQVLEKLKRPNDALVQYRKAAAAEPGNFVAQMNLGRLAYMSKDFKTAENAYSAAVKANPKSSLALGNLALVKSFNGKNAEAESLYKKAIAADKTNANAYEGLAYVYETQNKTAEAIQQLEKGRAAIKDQEQKGAMTERLAGLYERQGKQDLALKLWSERAKETKSADSYRSIARIQSSRGKLAEAAAAFEDAAKAPKGAQPMNDYLSAAQMWSRAGQVDKAIADTELAKRADPKKLDPYFTAAIIQSDAAVGKAPDKDASKADFSAALAEYDEALKLDPKSMQALIGKATLYERQKKYDEAIAQYRKVEETSGDQPNAPQILSKLGVLLTEAGKPDEALAEYRRLAEKYPKDAALEVSLADALEKKGDHDAAVAAYKAAYERDPKSSASLAKAAEVLTKQGKKDEARDLYLKLAETDPSGSDGLPRLKEIYAAEGKPDEYLQLLARLVMTQPKVGSPPYDTFLTEFAKAGRTQEALQKFEQLRAKQPLPQVLIYEGKALRMVGRPKDSVHTLSRALKEQPDNPLIHKELALSYLDLNNTERATAHLERVVNVPFSFDFDARDRLAGLYEKQGKKKEAMDLYRQTLQMNPADSKAKEAMDRLEGKPKAAATPAGPVKPGPAPEPAKPGATSAPAKGPEHVAPAPQPSSEPPASQPPAEGNQPDANKAPSAPTAPAPAVPAGAVPASAAPAAAP